MQADGHAADRQLWLYNSRHGTADSLHEDQPQARYNRVMVAGCSNATEIDDLFKTPLTIGRSGHCQHWSTP